MEINQITKKGFFVWMTCSVFFLYDFFLRVFLGIYQHEIMLDLDLSAVEFSMLSTTVFLTIYGLMQIPVGLLVDHLGLKKSLSMATFLCVVSCLGLSQSQSFSIAILFRLIMGFGASFGFICLLVSIHEWMPKKYFAMYVGISQFIGTLGAMFASGPIVYISSYYELTWRNIFELFSFLGFVLLMLVMLFVDNNHEKKGRYVVLNRPERWTVSLSKLVSSTQPWLIAILSALLYFTVEYLSENEGRAFLELKGLTPIQSNSLLTISWVGYALGCPSLGFLSDFIERRKIILMFSSFMLLMATLIFVFSLNYYLLMFSLFMIGAASSGQSIGFAIMAEQFKKQYIAVGFGLNNAFINLVAAFNAPMIAIVLEHRTVGLIPNLSSYVGTFLIFPAISLITVMISCLLIRETYCKSQVSYTILNKHS